MKRVPKLIRLSLLGFIFFLSTRTFADIIYVNHAAVGANNGTSWADAYTSLATALTSANSGDEIWVAQGVYKPTTLIDFNSSGGTDAREASFQIPDGVAVYGGFIGTELLKDERNWTTNLTILSGDIDNNDLNADANSIAETTADIVGNNAYHVVYTLNVNTTTRLDGFVVTAGKAQSADPVTDPNQDGGGWFNRLNGVINASSPTIMNTTFQGNFASSDGGALFTTSGTTGAAMTSLIQSCKFRNNESDFAGGAISLGSFEAGNYSPQILQCEFFMNEAFRRGGAIHLVGDHATVSNTLFEGNHVTAVSMNGTLPGSGGGVGMTASNAFFKECIFKENTTTGNPTGPFEGGGGAAVYMSANEPQTNTLGISQPRFLNCGFYNNTATGNTAAWGGAAVHLSDGGKLRPSYTNCVFAGNQAQDDGGAIANFARVIGVADGFVPELRPAYTNCTFNQNHAGDQGGALFNDGFVFNAVEMLQSTVENCILRGNTATVSGPEVFNTGSNTVSYSLVAGSGGSGGGWNASIGIDGGNNIDANPSFVNAALPLGPDNIPATIDDGLKLTLVSPAADAGNNSAPGLVGITQDYVLAARVQGGQVDMGAYEGIKLVIPDIDIYWLEEWRPTNPPCLFCPWAVIFSDVILQEFIWDGPAQLIDDGTTAFVKGKIVHSRNKGLAFNVNLKLVNKQNWQSWSSQGRTYFAISIEAIITAIRTHTRWSFWELSPESFLEGTGELSGQLNLTPFPDNHKTGFQLGTGANAWDKDLGLGGSFRYRGVLKYKGKNLALKGIGSVNVDAIPCETQCEALTRLPVDNSRKLGESPGLILDDDGFSVFPVPSRTQLNISLKSLPAGNYTLKLYNSLGQLKKLENRNLSMGVSVMTLHGLEPGVYILQVISKSGESRNKRILIQ